MLSDYQSFLIDNQNIMIDHLSMSNSAEARPPFYKMKYSIFHTI